LDVGAILEPKKDRSQNLRRERPAGGRFVTQHAT
jgi:hypothetical protein